MKLKKFTFRNSFGTEKKIRRFDCSGILPLSICVLTLVGLLDGAEPGSTVIQSVGNCPYMAVESATQLTGVIFSSTALTTSSTYLRLWVII